MKKKIENEINEINSIYEKTIDELTKSFKKKHEQLIEEENDMKEKMQFEVTKIKEKLEEFLLKCNIEIKLSEKINKGIKKLDIEDIDIIKTLSYISNISKNKKKMKLLLKEKMKNLIFYYKEEQNQIEYKECYFNGFPIPTNIEFKDITCCSLNISWKIDNYDNELNNEIKNVKYIVEMRKNNENLIKVYEGNDEYCKIDKLSMDTNYEIRICTMCNDSYGPWTEFHKIKTNIPESVILYGTEKMDEFKRHILDWCGYKEIELLYRGTRDGMTSKDFHNKCDNKGPTITLIQNEKGNVFGGYASLSWTSDNKWKTANDCFLFTLTNIHNTEPTKFPSKNSGDEVYHHRDYGPLFGYGPDIASYSDFINKDFCSIFPQKYEDILGKGNSIFTGDLNKNTERFKIKEIEVLKLIN